MNRPLNHDERMALIFQPFFITYFGRSYHWAGTIIGDRFPLGRQGEELLTDAEIESVADSAVYSIMRQTRGGRAGGQGEQ